VRRKLKLDDVIFSWARWRNLLMSSPAHRWGLGCTSPRPSECRSLRFL